MAGMLQIICFVMLGALLCYAAVSDAQRRIIPNWLTLTIAALAVPYWLGTGLELWPDIALQLCLAAGAFVIFAGIWSEERRVGKECISSFRVRVSSSH